jgi:hypothetical protein
MAENNPLQGKDFVQPGFLDEAMQDAEKFRKTLVDALADVKAEGKGLIDSLQKVNGATKDGQKVIEQSEKQYKDLASAQEKYERSLSDTETEIQKLKLATQQQQRVNKLTVKLNQSAEGSYDKLSAQYSLNKIELNKMSNEQRKATKSGQELESQTKAIYEEMKSLQEATGKHQLSVGDYAGEIGKLIPSLGAAQAGMQGLGASMKALVANPIGLVIAAVAGAFVTLFAAIKKTTGGAAFLEKVFANVGTVLDTVLGRIGRWISGEITFYDLLTNTGKALKENIQLTNDLVDARRRNEDQTAAEGVAIGELEKKIARLEVVRDSDAQSLQAQLDAAREYAKAIEEQQKLRIREMKRLQEEAALNWRSAESTEDKRLALNEYQNAVRATSEAEAELIRVQGQALDQIGMKQLDIFEQKADLLFDVSDRQKSINERIIADERTTNEERRRLLGENQDLIERDYDKLIGLYDEFFGVSIDQNKLLKMNAEEQYNYAASLGLPERAINRLREFIIEKMAADQDNVDTLRAVEKAEQDAAKAAIDRAIAMKREFITGSKERVEQAHQLALSEIDILETTEEEKTRLRLEAERKRLIALININEKFGGELSDLQIKQMQNVIKSIDQQIADTYTKAEERDLYSALGVTLDDEQKEQVNTSVQYIKDSLLSMSQTRVEAANRAVEASQRELENAQSFLEEQIALNDQGLQSDIEGAAKRLRARREANEKAIQQQRQAEQAQRRIQEAQAAGAMIVAAANIFKGFSSIPLIGQILAVAAVASMFASFASAKVQARRAANYGDGGSFEIDGGSHSSGQDVSFGVHGGVERKVEGGEKAGIFSRKAVRKYGSRIDNVIDAINAGMFEQRYGEAFTPAAKIPEYMMGNAGYDSSDLREAFVSESQKTRETLSSTISNIPQPIENRDESGYSKYLRKGNTLHQTVRKRNRFV